MNEAYGKIISAPDGDRLDLFLATAQRVGTTIQNIEKDFWVCWTLDALYNQVSRGGPRLLFKGGTSLSKGYGLISRFSEDIDITVFREDINAATTVEDLEKLTNTGQRKRLKKIRNACQTYINGELLSSLKQFASHTMVDLGKDPKQITVMPDPDDQDKQSLLIQYPSVAQDDRYIRPIIKIEGGAKSALDPHETISITPYLAEEIGGDDATLTVSNVTTILPKLTFLDKILILHGLSVFFSKRGNLYGAGRVSRHYYDVYCLINDPKGKEACLDSALVEACIKHACMFFFRKDTGLETLRRGSFQLTPPENMIDLLRRDYEAMADMIFGEVPEFQTVLESLQLAESLLNRISEPNE